MSKKVIKSEYNFKTKDITIDEHLNTDFREYSYYILTQRGIPLAQDSLINVQRVILTNAPDKLQGTNHLIGACTPYYHHGDASLSGAIARLARSFDNSTPLLNGDGFFGNSMAPAAGPRYTKCKASRSVSDMIKKYSAINEVDIEGSSKYLNLDLPIGLCTSILGIGIGYRSQILPRKLEEIQKYLDGKRADLKPYFLGFKGTIESNGVNAWRISSSFTINDNLGEIHIQDLPPMMRYDTFVEKLGELMENVGVDVRIQNSSKDHVDIKLKCKTYVKSTLQGIVDKISKIASISIPENLVFVDNNSIVEYKKITDYLDDFKVYRNVSQLKLKKHELYELEFERFYSMARIKFIGFLTGQTRKNDEISEFLNVTLPGLSEWKNDEKINSRIIDRLRSIPAWKATIEEVEQSYAWVTNLTASIHDKKKEIKEYTANTNFTLKSKGVNLLNTQK